MTKHELNASGDSSIPLPAHRSETFKADRTDGLFACLAFALGFLFIRWVLFLGHGWGVSLFTAFYSGVVTLYLSKKGKRMSGEAWFWLAILLLTGLSFSLWPADSLLPWQMLLLFCSAVYWVLSATKMTLFGKTSDWLPLDFLHGLLVIPFMNFGSQYLGMAALRKKQRKFERKFISAGLACCLL